MNINTINHWALIVSGIVTGLVLAAPAAALKSDRDQPAVIDADEVEMDFNTGLRTYRGNVYVQQGTIRVRADEIVVKITDGKLEHATATGNPAIFRQRPDGKEHDVIGKGRRMELDEIDNIVTLMDNASVKQNQDVITGAKMVYDMAAGKLRVNAGQQKKSAATADAKTPEGEPGAAEAPTGRVKLRIQPRNQEE